MATTLFDTTYGSAVCRRFDKDRFLEKIKGEFNDHLDPGKVCYPHGSRYANALETKNSKGRPSDEVLEEEVQGKCGQGTRMTIQWTVSIYPLISFT